MIAVRGLLRRAAAAWGRSMTAQIGVSITVVSVLLVLSSSAIILRITTEELRDGSELVMLANLAVLRDDLETWHYDLGPGSRQIVNRFEVQLGALHVALFDDQRRRISASDWYEVPDQALPARALPAEELPAGITHQKLEALQQRLGPVTTLWVTADGRAFHLLLADVTVPPAHARPELKRVRVAMALEVTQARDVVRRGRRIVVYTLLASAVAAGLLGLLIARRIVVVARRLGQAAGRISAHALDERLRIEGTYNELQESALAFNRMLDRLQVQFNRLSQFSSDLAHDLRTPINNLLGEAHVALARPRSAAEYREVLESATEDYERISRLIENMLFLARAEDPRASIQPEWVELATTGGRLREYFEPLAEENGLTLELCCPGADGSARVWADRMLLLRALANLISNALRYAPRGSSVRVLVKPQADGACLLEVANDGPAIPPEAQSRIFERLYRVDPSRGGSATGSGLGLAIVRSIMDLHGGRAEVDSAPGQATVFGLWFPPPGAEKT